MSVKTRLGRIPESSVVNQLCLGTSKCPGQHRSLVVNYVWVHESISTRASIPKEERSIYFQFHQWELGTDSQSPFLQFQSSSFISGSSYLFIIRSFISATKSSRNAESMLGTWVDTWIWRWFHHSIGKLQQHHQSTTTKLQVGVLRLGFFGVSHAKSSVLLLGQGKNSHQD